MRDRSGKSPAATIWRASVVVACVIAACAAPGAAHRPDATPVAFRVTEAGAASSIASEAVVPGKLAVLVFAHSISGTPCWTLASDGMRALGQPELALSLKREPGEPSAGYPRGLLSLFEAVYAGVAQGHLVDEGDVTVLPESAPPLVPETSLRAALYTRPQVIPDFPVEGPLLFVILINADEARAAADFGATRILGRLGHAARYFPTPPWTARRRQPVAGPDERAQSILAKVASPLPTRGVTVVKKGTVGARTPVPGTQPDQQTRFEAGSVVALELAPGAAARLAPALARLPATSPFALFTAIDPEAPAAFVWHPGDRSPYAITRGTLAGGEARSLDISGNFVLVVASETEQGARQVEDGFAVSVRGELLPALRQALAAGTPFTLEPTSGLSRFSIGPASPRAELAAAPARTGKKARKAALEFVTQGPIILGTPDSEIARLVATDALVGFISGIAASIDELAASTPPAEELDLSVMCQLGPSGTKTFVIAARPGERAGPFVAAAYAQLAKLDAPLISQGEIAFRSMLSVRANAGR